MKKIKKTEEAKKAFFMFPKFKRLILKMYYSRLKIKSAQSFDDYKKLLDDDSMYHPETIGLNDENSDRGIIIERMIQLAQNSDELDLVEGKNCLIKFIRPVLMRRVDIATTYQEIEKAYRLVTSELGKNITKDDQVLAYQKWIAIVKTGNEALDMLWGAPNIELHEKAKEKGNGLSLLAAETAITLEELKEAYRSGQYEEKAEEIIRKKWDRLSYKEVEAAKTIDELKIARSRSRICSQAWFIVNKKVE